MDAPGPSGGGGRPPFNDGVLEALRRRQQGSVELKRFDRSGSFSAGWADDDDDSDSSSDDVEGLDSGSWLPGGASDSELAAAPLFEPLGIEEAPGSELRVVKEAYAKKERECEHLRQIIKELSQSRCRVQRTKVELEEQFAALQKEYFRVVKVSELARTVSQQAVGRSSSLKQELSSAQDQLRRTRRRAAAADAKAAALRDENAVLKQKLLLLEQLRLSAGGDELGRASACAREYLFASSLSLY